MVATVWKRFREAKFTWSDLKRIQMGVSYRLSNTRIGERVIRLCARAAGIGAFDHIWAGTQVSEISFSLRPDHSKITFIHSLDYDQFRILPQRELTEPFICFIANPGGLGGDHSMMIPNPLQLQAFTREYFRRLNEVLEVIEERFAMPVIVAAHPRVSPQLYEPWVEGRQVVHRQTNMLIAKSSLVVAHNSTSIAIAALTYTPLLLVFLGDFAEVVDTPLRDQEYISNFVSMLGCATTDWTQPGWADKLRTEKIGADTSRCEHYVNALMKLPNTPDRPFWDVVLETKLNWLRS
jgi:hypothetical protein